MGCHSRTTNARMAAKEPLERSIIIHMYIYVYIKIHLRYREYIQLSSFVARSRYLRKNETPVAREGRVENHNVWRMYEQYRFC
jgi:hypothetical protein